jgi:tetratricopeptide (TPR) repeat protein
MTADSQVSAKNAKEAESQWWLEKLQRELQDRKKNLGFALEEKGDLDGAIKEYRGTSRLNPKNANAPYRLGLILDHRGDIDGAVAAYGTAVDLNTGDPQGHYRLGRALKEKGDLDAALRELQEANALDANNSTYRKAVDELRQQMRSLKPLRPSLAVCR